MNCSDITDLLGAYCAGELDQAEAGAVESHLASCAACMKEKQLMVRVMGALGNFERIEPREGFSASLWQRIDEWEAGKRVFWLAAFAGFLRTHRRALATGVAVFAVTLLTSVVMLQRIGGGPPREMAEVHLRGGRPDETAFTVDEGLMARTGLGASDVLTSTPGGTSENFVMRDIARAGEAAPETVYMHYVTGDRPVYSGRLREDYVYRPIVRPVSGTVRTF